MGPLREKSLKEIQLGEWWWVWFKSSSSKALEGWLVTNGIYLSINSSRIYWKLPTPFQIPLSQVSLWVNSLTKSLKKQTISPLSKFPRALERKRYVCSLPKGGVTLNTIPAPDSTKKKIQHNLTILIKQRFKEYISKQNPVLHHDQEKHVRMASYLKTYQHNLS